jgi:predicted TIM-barrel fold metal-dependent hydrolase
VVTIESTGFVPHPFGLQDEPGSPLLEGLLQTVPETVIIGHGPGFWSEIGPVASAENKAGSRVLDPPSGEGSLHRLFRTYPNLYADISARSGFTALTRDVEFGVQFLTEFQDRLMFGTDIVSADPPMLEEQLRNIERLIESLLTEGRIVREHYERIVWHYRRMPQLDYLKALVKEKRISQDVFDRIVGRNAAGLLKIN